MSISHFSGLSHNIQGLKKMAVNNSYCSEFLWHTKWIPIVFKWSLDPYSTTLRSFYHSLKQVRSCQYECIYKIWWKYVK